MRSVLAQTFALWQKHRVPRVAAALSFYAIFTVPPLVLVVVLAARAVLGRAHGLHTIDAELQPLLGQKGAQGVDTLVQASAHNIRVTPFFIGAALVIFAILAIFTQLQEALDDVWDIPEHKRGGMWEIVALRLHVLVAVIVLALLAILALSGAALGGRPGAIAVNAATILVFLTVAYRVLPRTRVSWLSCLQGAGITAAILLVGEGVISVYFAKAHPETNYGAAGSFIVVLLWVYYSAMLFLFGATLTRAIEDVRSDAAERFTAGRNAVRESGDGRTSSRR